MIARLRQWRACRQLNRLIRKRRESFAHQQYLKHRAAALKGRGPPRA